MYFREVGQMSHAIAGTRRTRAPRPARTKRPAPTGYQSIADAAAALTVSPNTARSYLKRGLLTGALVGGRLLIAVSSVDEFISRGGLYARGAA